MISKSQTITNRLDDNKDQNLLIKNDDISSKNIIYRAAVVVIVVVFGLLAFFINDQDNSSNSQYKHKKHSKDYELRKELKNILIQYEACNDNMQKQTLINKYKDKLNNISNDFMKQNIKNKQEMSPQEMSPQERSKKAQDKIRRDTMTQKDPGTFISLNDDEYKDYNSECYEWISNNQKLCEEWIRLSTELSNNTNNQQNLQTQIDEKISNIKDLFNNHPFYTF